MPEIEKKFPINLLNTDDAPHLLGEGDAINMRNLRVHASIGGKTGYIENILSNKKVPGMEGRIPAGSKRIASFGDPAGNFLIWFTHKAGSPGDDQINLYDLRSGLYWLVAKASMGTLGSIVGGLGFKLGVFYDLEVAEGVLYWTSSDNREPRKIHIGAGIKSCNPVSPVESPWYEGWSYDWLAADAEVANLSLAVKPPAYPPMIDKGNDGDVLSNNLIGESFQFATQFLYRTNEESTLSVFSHSSLINDAEQANFNLIEVVIDPREWPMPQGVKSMRLYVRVASTGKMFLVHTWDLTVSVPATMNYNFYGDYYGVPLSDSVAVEPFHSVPEEAGTLSLIKNRLFLGNTVEGKDTPASTSLRLQLGAPVDITIGESAKKKVQRVMYRGTRHQSGIIKVFPRFYYSGLYVKLDEVSPAGYYLIPGTEIRRGSGFTGIPAVFHSPVPSSVALSSLVYVGKNLNEIIEETRTVTIAQIYESYIRESSSEYITIDGLLASQNNPAVPAFLNFSDYLGGVVFYDRYLRKCGVVAGAGSRVSVPIRTFELDTAYNNVGWSLSNIGALTEIPEWAKYYSPVITRNSRALSLITGHSANTRYATVDPDGVYKFESDTEDEVHLSYGLQVVGIGLDTTSLINANLGYVAQQGDLCILVGEDNAAHVLPVLGSYGKYIMIAAKDIGGLEDKRFVYEIYTPFRVETGDYFYEVGQLYPVSQPGTEQRQYSIVSGNFLPDSYIIARSNGTEMAYRAYSMSPNDLYWKRWDTHFGRVNIKTELGRVKKRGNISFSDTFIEGTAVNGLSAFHALNETNLSSSMGALKKLVSVSKVQGEGNVLLAICEAQTASIYIGESELFDQSGNSFLAKSDNVIGQINPLRGDYGTLHPESVKPFKGQVFWWDQRSKVFIRYSGNGLYDISTNCKFARVSHQLARIVENARKEGKTLVINGGIDPQFREYLVQKKQYEAEVAEVCSSPFGVTVEEDPAEDFPGRVNVGWSFSEASSVFEWKLFDQNTFEVVGDSNFIVVGSPASLVVDEIIVGQPYTFMVRKKCGGDNVSPWVEAAIYVEGEDDGGEVPVCVPISFPGTIAWPSIRAGVPFSTSWEFDGSVPMNISGITKPSWASVVLSGRVVTISGEPPVESAGSNVNFGFTLSNCHSSNYVASSTINIKEAISLCMPLALAPGYDNALVGFPGSGPFLIKKKFTGSLPLTLAVTTKPPWMEITLEYGDEVHLWGTVPGTGGIGIDTVIFSVDNCANDPFVFSTEFIH